MTESKSGVIHGIHVLWGDYEKVKLISKILTGLSPVGMPLKEAGAEAVRAAKRVIAEYRAAVIPHD